MNRRLTEFAWRAVLWMAVLVPTTLSGQEEARDAILRTEPQANQALPAPTRPIESQERVFGEIENIRNQLGGGVAKHLFDSKERQEQANQEFRNEIRRLGSSGVFQATYQEPSRVAPMPARPGISSTPLQSSPEQLLRYRPPQPASLSGGQSNSRMNVDLLRDSARQLEQIAAELEFAEMYSDADRIRGQAQDFWMRARGAGPSENRNRPAVARGTEFSDWNSAPVQAEGPRLAK